MSVTQNNNVQFYTGYNYQKEFVKSSRTDSVAVFVGPFPGVPVTINITHGLNKISSVRVWYDPGLGSIFPASFLDFGGTLTNFVTVQYYLTSTTLSLVYYNASGGALNVTTYYTIYYDA